jgi:hypothetical protein
MNCCALTPFTVNLSPRIELSVTVDYKFPNLFLIYKIIDKLQSVRLPSQKEFPQRRDGLWQHTCFEFFLAPLGKPNYWEFNLAPSHDWNCYRFTDYRQGMVLETAWHDSPFQIQQSDENLDGIGFGINLQPLISQPQPLQLGISTVIETETGELSYWALHHPGTEADFHQRRSWSINLF